MSDPVTFTIPTLDLPIPPRNQWEREYRAFLQMLPELLKTHRDRYVAVHEGRVVDDGDDELELASRVWAKYGYVPIHVDLVTDRPRPPERVPHFRVPSPERTL